MANCPINKSDDLKRLLALAEWPRDYVKIGHHWSLSKEKYSYKDTNNKVKRLYDKFGVKRRMWGTDWTMVEKYSGYAKALALYWDELPFFAVVGRRWILGGTELRLWLFA